MIRFVPFVALFLSIYAAMHALVYWGVRPLLSSRASVGVVGVMAVMTTLPVLVRILDRGGLESLARPVAIAGYLWMGVLFLAFALFLPLALWHAVRGGASLFLPAAAALPGHGPSAALIALSLALAGGGYGLFEAGRLRTEHVRLETTKLPPGMESLRMVQISDLHLGLLSRSAAALKVADAVAALNPHVVVATGDVVDAQINHITSMAAPFHALRPPLGKFAVTGNHEIYAGLPQSLDFLRKSGFIVLRNESVVADGALAIAGVDDPAARREVREADILGKISEGRFTVLLKHRPEVDPTAVPLFDLQLSGHAHRGQIFPFSFLTGLAYPLQDGLYRLAGGAHLYTSRGTGTWGPPMRVFSPPEITLFEIVRASPPRPTGR